MAEGQRERYQFTWPGKREAKAEARRPIFKTMIPEPEKSKDWDTTENLYIEGDNLEALKLLKETYAGQFDLIYIDPPYNTGNDFVYNDDYAVNRSEYDAASGEYDDQQNRLVKNLETSGRFHSDWCTMLYPRLMLSKDLLSAKGVLAISIGCQEIHNLLKICEELFSGKTVIPVTVQTSGGKPNKGFSVSQEYVVFVAPSDFEPIPAEEDQKSYSSPYHGMNLATFTQSERPNQAYPIFVSKEGVIVGVGKTLQKLMADGEWDGAAGDYIYDASIAPEGTTAVWPITSKGEQCVWRLIPERLLNDWEKGYIKVVKQAGNEGRFGIQYLSGGIITKIESGELETHRVSDNPEIPTIEVHDYKTAGASVPTVWTDKKYHSARGSAQVKSLFNSKVFSYPKPVDLVQNVEKRVLDRDGKVLDFFSGSATTAHATMDLNARDGGLRSYVLVQLPERCEEGSEGMKAGYANLCEIGEERIRRAGEKIRAEIDEANQQLEIGADPKPYPDLGFRVLRIDSSNMKDSYLKPGETTQESLFDQVDNVKEGRTDLDLLFEVLPKFRIPYSAKIEERMLAGKKLFFVDDNRLAACFDASVGTDTIEEMAKAKPWIAVMRDASMADDATQANFAELFRTYSPDTHIAVI